MRKKFFRLEKSVRSTAWKICVFLSLSVELSLLSVAYVLIKEEELTKMMCRIREKLFLLFEKKRKEYLDISLDEIEPFLRDNLVRKILESSNSVFLEISCHRFSPLLIWNGLIIAEFSMSNKRGALNGLLAFWI